MENCDDRGFLYGGLEQVFGKLTFLTLHLYSLWLFPHVQALLQADLFALHLLLCRYRRVVHLHTMKIRLIVLPHIHPVHHKEQRLFLRDPIQWHLLVIRLTTYLYLICVLKWWQLFKTKKAAVLLRLQEVDDVRRFGGVADALL